MESLLDFLRRVRISAGVILDINGIGSLLGLVGTHVVGGGIGKSVLRNSSHFPWKSILDLMLGMNLRNNGGLFETNFHMLLGVISAMRSWLKIALADLILDLQWFRIFLILWRDSGVSGKRLSRSCLTFRNSVLRSSFHHAFPFPYPGLRKGRNWWIAFSMV